MGAMLLNHLSRPNVRRHGVEILGEAVVQGEHTMFLIAEASDENHLREFLQPFQMAGSVDVFPASTCARVVASGGCGEPLPVSDVTPALDPEEICQHAIDAGLLVHRAHPLNCETPLTELPHLLGEVDPNRPTVVVCGSGYRSSIASAFLEGRGVTQLANAVGGMAAWNAAGLETVKPAPIAAPAMAARLNSTAKCSPRLGRRMAMVSGLDSNALAATCSDGSSARACCALSGSSRAASYSPLCRPASRPG